MDLGRLWEPPLSVLMFPQSLRSRRTGQTQALAVEGLYLEVTGVISVHVPLAEADHTAVSNLAGECPGGELPVWVATINVHHRTRRLVSWRQAASASHRAQQGEGRHGRQGSGLGAKEGSLGADLKRGRGGDAGMTFEAAGQCVTLHTQVRGEAQPPI